MYPIFTSNFPRIYELPFCKDQKYYLWNMGINLEKARNVPVKFRKEKKNDRLLVGFDPTISSLEVERANNCTVLSLF